MSRRKNEIELIARGIVTDGSGNILLCRNVKHGYHYLPGGHVEFGEQAAAALAREFMEETGAVVQVGHLALVTENIFSVKDETCHEINLVFHVKPSPSAVFQSRESKIAFDWVPISDLRSHDVRPSSIGEWIMDHALTLSTAVGPWLSATI